MNGGEISWGWYAARSSGLLAFLLLYSVIFLGLAIRLPILKKIIKPRYSFGAHCWLSLQALIFSLVHGVALLFDKMFNFSWWDIFVPFYFKDITLNTNFLALGIIGFYLMLILVISSYAIRFIGGEVWRVLHFLNISLYIFVVIHSYFLGTDLKNLLIRDIFIWMNAFLIFLLLTNFTLKSFSKKRLEKEHNQNNPQRRVDSLR